MFSPSVHFQGFSIDCELQKLKTVCAFSKIESRISYNEEVNLTVETNIDPFKEVHANPRIQEIA